MTDTSTLPGSTSSRGPSRNELSIAIIGLVGVLTTACLSNWDKIFPSENVVKSTFTGYQPTGDPQVEIRYFMEIVGMRDEMSQMQAAMLDHFRQLSTSEPGANPEEIEKVFKLVEEEFSDQYDKTVNAYVAVASKYFSVQEVQELNKFYSTPTMREMVRKRPLLTREFMQISMPQIQKSEERLRQKIEEFLKSVREKQHIERTDKKQSSKG